MIFHTDRLALRPSVMGDADALFAILGDSVAMRFWDRAPLPRAATAAEFLRDQIAAMADGDYLYWTVWQGADAIGSVDVSAIDRTHRRADMGFLFRRDAWGQGYAREALRPVIDHAFGALGLARLSARIQAGNERAARLLGVLGFAQEGLLRSHVLRDGERRDCIVYGLLR